VTDVTPVVTERNADPGAIWGVVNGLGAYFATVAAVRLGVFDALAEAPLGIGELAVRLGATPTRLASLCDALVGLELLTRQGDAYRLTSAADTFLVSGRPRSMRELVLHSPGPWENWPALDATVLGAVPPAPVSESFYRELVRATFPTQHAVAVSTAEHLGPVERICDLGAGAAPWTIAFLEASPDARAVVNDLPSVAAIAQETIDAAGLGDRCAVLPGDYFTIPLQPATFDIVVLAHVLRAEGPARARRLLARAASALRPGGRVVVADYFVADDHCGPLNALLLGATMMAATDAGATFTYADCRAWLAEAQFTDVELLSPLPFQEVMIAHKPGRPT
jgi:SAM-dependent methyltransferase